MTLSPQIISQVFQAIAWLVLTLAISEIFKPTFQWWGEKLRDKIQSLWKEMPQWISNVILKIPEYVVRFVATFLIIYLVVSSAVKQTSEKMNNQMQQMKMDEGERITKLTQQLSVLQQNDQGREIKSEDINFIKQELLSVKGQRIVISAPVGNSEAFNFASSIKNVFSDAGWIVDGVNQFLGGDPFQGIRVNIRDKSNETLAYGVCKVFLSYGCHTVGLNPSNAELEISIGEK